MDFLDAHEPSGENVSTMDGPLFDFLVNLEKEGALENTHILFWSDHGHHHHPFSLSPKSNYDME